jgi:hypothetical protein
VGADLLDPLFRAGAAGGLQSAAASMSLPLVARDRDGQVVGALPAVPSGTVASTVSQLQGYERYARAVVDAPALSTPPTTSHPRNTAAMPSASPSRRIAKWVCTQR